MPLYEYVKYKSVRAAATCKKLKKPNKNYSKPKRLLHRVVKRCLQSVKGII